MGVVAIRFRALDGSTPKYKFMKHDIGRLYNVPILKTARKIVITEGELDALSAISCGLQAISIPGAKHWKPEWRRLLRYRDITILCDGDEAGREFGERLTSELVGARMVMMPSSMDVNDCYREYGADWIRAKVGL